MSTKDIQESVKQHLVFLTFFVKIRDANPTVSGVTGVIVGRKAKHELYVITCKPGLLPLVRSKENECEDPMDWDGVVSLYQPEENKDPVKKGRFRILWPSHINDTGEWLLCVTDGLSDPYCEIQIQKSPTLTDGVVFLCGHGNSLDNEWHPRHGHLIKGAPPGGLPDWVNAPFKPKGDATTEDEMEYFKLCELDLHVIIRLPQKKGQIGKHTWVVDAPVRPVDPGGLGGVVTNLAGQLIGILIIDSHAAWDRAYMMPISRFLEQNKLDLNTISVD